MSSAYPDGSVNPDWTKPLIALPKQRSPFQVRSKEVHAIICHKRVKGLEQYLVQWTSPAKSTFTTYSWHDLSELANCCVKLQQYINSRQSLYTTRHLSLNRGLKRKTPDTESSYSSETESVLDLDDDPSVYNGTLRYRDDYVTIKPVFQERIELPTDVMIAIAARTPTLRANYIIACSFDHHLRQAAGDGPRLSIVNEVDTLRPSLDFRFITKNVIGAGVEPVDTEAVVGCGARKPGMPQRCRPDMGQNIGCEYTKVCDCLEYAAVDEKRLNAEEKLLHDAGEVAGLPKRFPYLQSGPKTLQSFYLNSRSPIYECNPRCACGSNCKTRNVQHGRQVPLEIFKTKNRGWGLRCLEDLHQGQFIDTYVGEIITNEEADRREARAGAGKSSYLYTLDKEMCRGCDDPFHDMQCLKEEDCYVVDGEFMGNVTRFINHSCQPNCRQYTVSYNKYDRRVYELAFFAYVDIVKGTELTFDYMDQDDVEADVEEQGELDKKAQPCMCGAQKCRGSFGFTTYEKEE